MPSGMAPDRAEEYRERATQLRQLADATPNSLTRERLCGLAEQFDDLAAHIEAQIKSGGII